MSEQSDFDRGFSAAIRGMRRALTGWESEHGPGSDMTECGHSKFDPCHNCEVGGRARPAPCPVCLGFCGDSGPTCSERHCESPQPPAEAQPVAIKSRMVGCEGDDGLIREHPESGGCDVCRPQPGSLDPETIERGVAALCVAFGWAVVSRDVYRDAVRAVLESAGFVSDADAAGK